MADDRRCPRCGQAAPPDVPTGTCPACLLRAGLERELRPPRRWTTRTTTRSPSASSRPAPAGCWRAWRDSIGSIPRVLLPDTAHRRPRCRRHQAVVGRDARARPSAAIATSSSARSPAAAWAPSSRAATPTSAATWPSRSCSRRTATSPSCSRRFVEEAQIGGQLQHPGIVPVYELGTFADRRPYFTMKLVKGRTLAALLARAGRPAATTCRGSWGSSSRSARRWPTPTPGA